jgi:hypothetical protein
MFLLFVLDGPDFDTSIDSTLDAIPGTAVERAGFEECQADVSAGVDHLLVPDVPG